MKTAVIAVGGNAILRPGDPLTQENQLKHVTATSKGLADLIQKGYDIVITHGNGPQVGNILLRTEIAKDEVSPNALDARIRSTSPARRLTEPSLPGRVSSCRRIASTAAP